MRILITGGRGQVGRELVRVCEAAGDEVLASDATASTSPTATRCPRRGRHQPRRDRPRRRLDRGRRLRVRGRPRLPGQRPRHPARGRRRPPRRRPPRVRVDRLRLRRHEAHAVRRVGRAEPPASTAGRSGPASRSSTRPGPASACRGCAATTAPTWSRPCCASPTARVAFVDDQHGAPRSPTTWPMLLRLGVERRPGIYHVTNPGAISWYGFVRDILRPSARTPTGSGRSPPPARPAPARAPPGQLGARQRRAAPVGFPPLQHYRDALNLCLMGFDVLG